MTPERPAPRWDYVPEDEADLIRCLAYPVWRICSGALYKIMVKSPEQDAGGEPGPVLPFVPNRAQRRLLGRLHYRNIILKARQLGFCVDPSTRVLTADLRWVRIADMRAGDEVVSVDEHAPGGKGQQRRMRTATVQAAVEVHRKAYRITFDDGRSVVCTDRHPWLTRKAGDCAEWRSLSGEGNQVVGRIQVGTHVRWVAKPWDEPTHEDGWMGGMLDGEGSMAKANSSASVNVSQRPGPVWDRLVKYASDRGYNACIEGDAAERPGKYGKTPVPKLAFGRMDEMFRLMGQTRPTRFIARRWWDGREMPGKRNGDVGWATVTSIEPVGERTMIDLQTSTGTYIAEGFVSHNTTLACIMWLDHALFNSDQRCGIVAQDREAAEVIFRDKVKFAYDRLPAFLREQMPLARDSASELLFGHNNSSVRVATSMRSGTIHRLHVSEFGKICARYPDKAREVTAGSLPAVPVDGIAIIESTAEGRDGAFFKMVAQAMALKQRKAKLTNKDFEFHFFPWWEEDTYELDVDAGEVLISEKDHAYFQEVEQQIGRDLRIEKRRWYVATRESDFQGDPELMWQEYPSTPEEAFQVSTEGTYYAAQLADARKQGRVTIVPINPRLPVNTFWDIGKSDGTGIWLHQFDGLSHRFVGYIEGWNEPYNFFAQKMQAFRCVWGTHYVPHDAEHKRQTGTKLLCALDELKELPIGGKWKVVPRIDDLQHGIQLTREAFSSAVFDAEACKEGLIHLAGYRKQWNEKAGAWSDVPVKNVHREGADSFRQWAQSKAGIELVVYQQRNPAPRAVAIEYGTDDETGM